jgi:hypothetical protein
LATWLASGNSLKKKGEELALSVLELRHDFHDFPTGHLVVRRTESGALLRRLQGFDGRLLSFPNGDER